LIGSGGNVAVNELYHTHHSDTDESCHMYDVAFDESWHTCYLLLKSHGTHYFDEAQHTCVNYITHTIVI